MLKTVPITSIKPPTSATDGDHVKRLAQSFEVIDMLNPITVDTKMNVRAGKHRYRAAKLLGRDKIAVNIIDTDDLRARIVTLDENLCRRTLTVLEQGDQLLERERLYTELFPDAEKRGGDRSKRRPSPTAPAFTKATAEATSQPERTVRERLQIAKKISPKAKKLIAKTEAANSTTDLRRLAQIEPKHQVAVAERVAETGETVKQAAKALNREKQVDQAKAYVLPAGEWPVIAIDPPWSYDDKLDGSDAARGGTPYPSMSIEEIAALELPLAKDAAVFLWVTNSHLIDPEAYAIVAATWKGRYGLEPKGIATWEKDKLGLGHYFRNKTEHLVLLVRGKPVFTEEKPWSHFRAPVGEHSEKPAAAYMAIEKFCAATQRLELFARAPRPGWVTTGSELPANEMRPPTHGRGESPISIWAVHAVTPDGRTYCGMDLKQPLADFQQQAIEQHRFSRAVPGEMMDHVTCIECSGRAAPAPGELCGQRSEPEPKTKKRKLPPIIDVPPDEPPGAA